MELFDQLVDAGGLEHSTLLGDVAIELMRSGEP
jgi:hypothetical protein